MALPRPVLAFLCVLWLVPAARADFSLRYRLVDRFGFSFDPEMRLLTADVDGDGQDDLVRAVPGRVVSDSCGPGGWHVRWDATIPDRGNLMAIGDATGDGRTDILAVSGRESLWVTCNNPASPGRHGAVAWRAGPYLERCPTSPKMGSRGSVGVSGPLDVEGDGHPEVFLHINPYVPGVEPRRLLCLDGASGREKWRIDLACPPGELHLLVRRHGERHLVLETYSPDNGFVVGDEDDAHCYVISLSPDGKREWSLPIGGVHCSSSVAIADLDGDGDENMIVTTDVIGAVPQPPSPGAGRLLVLDPASGRTLRRFEAGGPLQWLKAVDLDDDGRPEILGGGRDGALRCYDYELTLKWISGARPVAQLNGIADLDGDLRKEIVCTAGATLRVLDHRGRLRVEKELPGTLLQVQLMRLAGRVRLAIAGGRDGRVLSLEPPTASPAVLTLGGGLLLLSSGGTAYALHRRRRRREALVDRSEAHERLLDALVAFAHSGSSLAVLHRLQLYLRNWERAESSMEARATLEALLNDLENSVLPALTRLVAVARRAQVRPALWRPLAARALVVSSEVHQLLDDAGAAGDHRSQAMAALEQVDTCLAGLRAHVRRVFLTQLEPALRRLKARHAEALAATGTTMEVDPGSAANLSVFIAPDHLDGVLDNLVVNATRAMGETVLRRIHITVAPEGGACRLDVTDTGCGIPEALHARVFDRDYTTHEGGGFGLYFSRQTLARYEGRIFVQRSTLGEGTTFGIVLRLA